MENGLVRGGPGRDIPRSACAWLVVCSAEEDCVMLGAVFSMFIAHASLSRAAVVCAIICCVQWNDASAIYIIHDQVYALSYHIVL